MTATRTAWIDANSTQSLNSIFRFVWLSLPYHCLAPNGDTFVSLWWRVKWDSQLSVALMNDDGRAAMSFSKLQWILLMLFLLSSISVSFTLFFLFRNAILIGFLLCRNHCESREFALLWWILDRSHCEFSCWRLERRIFLSFGSAGDGSFQVLKDWGIEGGWKWFWNSVAVQKMGGR